jgi:hypothetical protein
VDKGLDSRIAGGHGGDVAGATGPQVQEVVGLWVQVQARLQAHFAALAAEHSLSMMQAKVLTQLDTHRSMRRVDSLGGNPQVKTGDSRIPARHPHP